MGHEQEVLAAVETRLDSVDAAVDGGELVAAISGFVSALQARPTAEQSCGAEVAGYLTGLLERKLLASCCDRQAALCTAVAAQAERLAAGRPLDLAPIRQALAKRCVTDLSTPAPGTK